MIRRFPENDRRLDAYSALRTWDLADAGVVKFDDARAHVRRAFGGGR